MTIVIYGLYDPRDDELRYVGATSQRPRDRLAKHLRHSVGAKREWIATLRRIHLTPMIKIIETTGENWRSRERFWIAEMRSLGNDLLNAAPGGGGCPIGYRHTVEAREKISIASQRQKGRPSPHRGRRLSAETIAKMSRAQKGKIILPEQRLKIAEKLRGQTITESTREKLRQRGFSDDHRSKLSEAAREHWRKLKESGHIGGLGL